MDELNYFWILKNVGGIQAKYIALRKVYDKNGDCVSNFCRDVPLWFAEFCLWNTAGVSAACTHYLGEYGEKDLPDKNPFDVG